MHTEEVGEGGVACACVLGVGVGRGVQGHNIHKEGFRAQGGWGQCSFVSAFVLSLPLFHVLAFLVCEYINLFFEIQIFFYEG